MRKKTRKRSYKNTIAIGIASFASIALLSTGLAAFVLIRDAQKTVDGNFVVADVTDASIKLNITVPEDGTKPKLIIDAEKGDDQGRVQIQQGGDGAVLEYTFKGNVEVAESKTISDNLELYYIVNIKNGSSVFNKDFTEEFIDTGKLVLVGGVLPKDGVTGIMPLTEGKGLTLVDEKSAKFEFTFGFNWGAKYGNKNPSIFFDSIDDFAIEGTYGSGENLITYLEAGKVKGASIPDNVVQQELVDLKAAENYTFEIVVYAKNK